VTLGTTLVFKAVSGQPVYDPAGAIYNHRHPAGGYLPGAASSTGAEWIGAWLGAHADLEALGKKAAKMLPTRQAIYPLVRSGERFPFARPSARGFGLDQNAAPEEVFAAGMEGVAYLERLGIQRFAALGFRIGERVYATGGAVAGETWMRIRAAVSRRTFMVPEYPECAMGAAILAASASLGGCQASIRKLVRVTRQVEPEDQLARAYDDGFERLRLELQRRGYL
jgi:sugar (pentulose or hexulose) kinase